MSLQREERAMKIIQADGTESVGEGSSGARCQGRSLN